MSFSRTLKLGLTVLTVSLAACGGSKGGGGDQAAPAPADNGGGGAPTASFADVNAILTDHCVACHSDTDHKPHFIGHEDVVKQNAQSLIDVLTTTDPAKAMPKVRKTTPALTDAQKQVFVAYAAALKANAANGPSFDNDIQPILTSNCAMCHADSGRAKPHFVGHKDVFDQNIATIVDKVTTTDKAEVMPPAQSVPLSADEKAKVLGYLQAVK